MATPSATRVKITDECGRVPPKTVDLYYLEEVHGLSADDVDFILDQCAESGIAYVGEWKYELADSEWAQKSA